MQRAQRFKATYASLGLTVADVGKLLHVTPRTLHNWNAGRSDIPYAAFKLLRVLLHYELPSPAWEGWHFSGGVLYTPEDRPITAHESSWWSLLVRRANSADFLYYKNLDLQEQLAAARSETGTHRAELATHEGVPVGGQGGLPELRVLVTPQQNFTGEKKAPSQAAPLAPYRPDFRVRYTLAAGGAR